MSKEYLDIYNEDGLPTGETGIKKEIHKIGFWHHAVHIWLLNSKNELLIQKRAAHLSRNPNKWNTTATGHVSAGEDDLTGAKREVREELGLDIPENKFIHIGTVKKSTDEPGYKNREFNPIYIIKKDIDLLDITLQLSEVSDVKYISIAELKKHIDNKNTDYVLYQAEYKLLFDYLEGRR